MPDIIIVDGSGHEHIFPEGFDPKRAAQIVRNSQLKEANDKPLKEPTTEEAGRSAGWKSYLDDLGGSMFESLAHPGLQRQGGDSIEGRYETKDKLHTAGDLAALALPTSIPLKRMPGENALTPIASEPIGNRAMKFGLRRTADALDLTPNIISSEAEKRVIAGLRRAGTVDNGVRPTGADIGPRVMPKQAASEPVRQPYTAEPEQIHPQPSGLDHFMPNQPGEVTEGVPQGDLPTPSLNRYMANQPSGAEHAKFAATPNEPTPTTGLENVEPHMPNSSGEVTPGVPQEDHPRSEIADLFDRYMANSPADAAPAQTDVARSPSDVRSAKIAESAKGGDDLGQLLDAIHGTTEEDATPAVIKTGNGETQPSYVNDYLKSTERPSEWHSGDKPGSPEAKNAQLLHRSEGELNAGYRAHIPGPLDDLLASILAAAKQ